ncbi:BF3164 family lipoprotein [Formosa sp. 3Alg 14/1]|uniref:BF3164 family lipoprotein n=1 Tax=Formosa sp. 3Alg 14/1 TaxID=3382190 RepID=UPI0039BE07A7
MIDKTNSSEKDSVFIKEYNVNERYYSITFKDSLTYYGTGKFNSLEKFDEIDLPSGTIIEKYGFYENVKDSLRLNAYLFANRSFIYFKLSGEKIVLANMNKDCIEIFDLKEGKSKLISGPERYQVMYNSTGKGENSMMEPNKDTRYAFVGGTVSNEYIYLVYSGGKMLNDENPYFGKSIYIYDWNGNPIRQLNFTQEILGLAISKNNDLIFTYDANNGYIIKAKI